MDEPAQMPPTVCKGVFVVRDLIAKGAFGAVYAGHDVRTGGSVAIKVEAATAPFPQLLYEYAVLQTFNHGKHPGIPHAYWFAAEPPYNILIMQRLGPCLPGRFPPGSKRTRAHITNIAIQGLRRLEIVHKTGFVHRDMKPENFMFGFPGSPDESTLFLIDFGLAKRMLGPDGTPIPCEIGKPMTGTPRYASLNVHAGLQQCARDDLEAFVYVLMFMVRGSLPWQMNGSEECASADGADGADGATAASMTDNNVPVPAPAPAPTSSDKPSKKPTRKEAYVAIAYSKEVYGCATAAEIDPRFAELLEYARALPYGVLPNYDQLVSQWTAYS
jgi:serine/threonine protein kinase